jgi:hypothetical protein
MLYGNSEEKHIEVKKMYIITIPILSSPSERVAVDTIYV